MHEVNPETDYPTSIYTESGNVHLGYYKVLSDMREYLESGIKLLDLNLPI